MMRALWTAASGMNAHQISVDVISNNLANVNTVGYKKETAQFESLFYQTLQKSNTNSAAGTMQVGHGVRPSYIAREFSTGSMQQTGKVTDLAIQGNGFFAVSMGKNEVYTKDGGFQISQYDDWNYTLATAEGYPLLTQQGTPILINRQLKVEDITISKDGMILYKGEEYSIELGQIKVVQFTNPEGLLALGSNLFEQSQASGKPRIENEVESKSIVLSGYLEGANVQVADEMVKLIVAQRAYEMNSTTIKTADAMLQQANELKRI